MLPGSLVVYAKDLRYVCASNLYVVLAGARGKKIKIHSICTMGGTANTWAPNTRKPMNALVSDLTPISAWGMFAESITTEVRRNGDAKHTLTVRRDPMLAATATRAWGRQYGAVWDWMPIAEIRKTEHAELIKKRMIADYLGEDEEAA